MKNTAMDSPILIIGAGSWGTALALHLAKTGQEVRLWSHEKDHIEAMAVERVNNRFLPDCPFPDTLKPIEDLNSALKNVQDILIAVPSVGFRSTLTNLKSSLNPSQRIVWATKGMDLETGQLLHDVAKEILGSQISQAVLSGPSFAKEVATGLPTAVVIASQDARFANDLVQRFNTPFFRTYLSDDITGVEIGGVVKNVLAIATGMSDGMGFGANARCALITRGLSEMMRLGIALGGKQETFVGLTGLGDLVLTCTDDQSRNRRFGLALGKGKKPQEAEKEIGQVVEGKRNAELVVAIAKKNQVEMPLVETVWDILQGKYSLKDAIQILLSRDTKPEI
jgi:glycerol-3-phosphate dehydrogenase (NAD(P)+)